MNQGIEYANQQTTYPDYFLFTDADIYHHPENLSQLIAKAETENLDLVSLMVLLHCKSLWEKLLIPAFVFFLSETLPISLGKQFSKICSCCGGGLHFDR